MSRIDAGTRFWLRYVETLGGIWEDGGDGAVVVLPESLQREYQRADEMVVTNDPDMAREDGATLLFAGHPYLMHAAEAVLAQGDCGVLRLARSPTPQPDADQLLAAARDQFPIDHGRIDATGGVNPGVRTVLRVGALVTFALSSDDHFQEQMECWVDVPSRLAVPGAVSAQLARGLGEEPTDGDTRLPAAAELLPAMNYAHEQIGARARERESELSRQAGDECARETERAMTYYDEALRSLQRRLDTAAAERVDTLTARMKSTRGERDRRLTEITEKYRAQHTTRPFRLHALAVPVLRLPVDVRRGDRRYPLTLDWITGARTFAGLRCPGCGSTAPLVAAKTRLGCQQCLPSRRVSSGPARPATAAVSKPLPQPPGPPATPPGRPPEQLPPARRQAAHRDGRASPASAHSARSPQAINKAGRKLAESLWDLAVSGDRRIRRLYAPHSPAAAMHRLFGPTGPLRAVGMDPRDQPASMSSSGSHPAPNHADMLIVPGEVEGENVAYAYQMCWRYTGGEALIEELTPFPSAYWPRMPAPRYLAFSPAARRLYESQPEPRLEHDPVARSLWQRGTIASGIPLVLRYLAAWWRIEDREQLASRYSFSDLAAAIDRMVAYRAGAQYRYDDAAAMYGADADRVRAATTYLQAQLRLSATCPW